MHKYRFENDYSELCHPAVIEALGRMGTRQFAGYSQDVISQEAVALLRDIVEKPDAGVHFLSGGTQANLVGLGWMLSPIGAVVAADTGHINVYEAGAIEATGHKVCTVPHRLGKLDLGAMEKLLEYHQQEELVTPEVVFLSQSTELGTIYRKSELEGIRAFCNRWNLLLFIDGARIGAAVASDISDVQMADIAEVADAFFIGGTKNGALFGEALITVNPKLDKGFRSFSRQRGAMLARAMLSACSFANCSGTGCISNWPGMRMRPPARCATVSASWVTVFGRKESQTRYFRSCRTRSSRSCRNSTAFMYGKNTTKISLSCGS